MMKLYENIKKFRLERGLSQDELAILVGYKNRSSIAQIERGDVDLPQNKIVKFAEVFDVYAGDLMGWHDGDGNDLYSADEKAVILRYRKLNNSGRKMVRQLLDDFAMIPRYAKTKES